MQRAVISAPGGPLVVKTEGVPSVPVGGAIVRTRYAGVCHSELHFIKDEMPLGQEKIFRIREKIGDDFLKITPGHEICGVIESLGPNANPKVYNLAVGDNVCVYPWIGCQKCETCVLGMNNLCENNEHTTTEIGQNPASPGGFSTHVPVPHCRFLIKVPDNIPMTVACMLPCSASTAYASLLKVTPYIRHALRSRAQANLLLIGAGGLGLWGVQLAKKGLFADDNVNVYIADVGSEKVSAALEMGADGGFVWGQDVEENLEMTTTDVRMDAVVNYFGSQATCEVGVRCLRKGGALAVVGLGGVELPLGLVELISNSITVIGLRTSSVPELSDMVQLVSRKAMGYPNIRHFRLCDVNDALDELKAGRITGRAIIDYTD